jgi:hypothetical protein
MVAVALLVVGCGKKDSDGDKAATKPATGGDEIAADDSLQGCTGPGHTLVKLGGDFAKTWCITIYFGGYGDCIDFPPPETGFDVNFDDPDAKKSDSSNTFRLQLREKLAAGIEYQLSKGPDGTVIRSADGVEDNANGVSFDFTVTRDGTAFMSGVHQDGWTTGTIRVTKVPAKSCDNYELAFDLELHHPGMKTPAKLTATGVAFR